MTLYCLGVELVQASSFKVDQGEHGAAEAVSSNTPDVVSSGGKAIKQQCQMNSLVIGKENIQ